jgi:hypothetical protein
MKTSRFKSISSIASNIKGVKDDNELIKAAVKKLNKKQNKNKQAKKSRKRNR